MEIVTETGEIIHLNKVSYRELTLTAPLSPMERYDLSTHQLTSITVENIPFKINSIVKIKERGKFVPFHINYIIKIQKNQYSLLVTKINNVSMFMLATLFDTATECLFPNNLINAYIGLSDMSVTGNIHIAYRYTGDRGFYEFEQKISQHKNLLDSYCLDNFHSMYEFSVPDKYINEYSLFLEGKYSEFSEHYKDKLCKFYSPIISVPVKNTRFYKIIYKDEGYRKKLSKDLGIEIPKNQELGNKPDKNEFFQGEFLIEKSELIC